MPIDAPVVNRNKIKVQTEDGSVSADAVRTIKVTNGTLTVNPDGSVSIQTGGGGGGGTIGGSIGATRVAYASALDTITGEADFTYDQTNNLLTAEKIKGQIILEVNNATASAIPAGTPVYVDSVGAGGKPNIAPADSNDSAKMPSIGLVPNQIPAASAGYICLVGQINGLSLTSGTIFDSTITAADIGKTVYVSTTVGLLTVTKPTTASDLVQNVGRIIDVAGTCKIEVVNIGRTNDVPNQFSISGNITAASFITSGGTSSDFVKGDGSLDSATYMASWDLDGDTGSTITVSGGTTLDITGGTGISTSGTGTALTITNDSPDQTVSLTGAGTTGVTGTYPSFTITSNDQFDGTVTDITAAADSGTGTAITSSGTLTFTGGSNINTTVSGTTVTIDATGLGSGTVTSITPAADSGTGTAITTSGTLTYTGGTNVTTSVSGTTVTIDSTDQYTGTVTSITPAADSGTGTAITTSGSLTFTGGTNVTTSVTGTTVTIDSTDQFTGTVTSVGTGDGLTGGPITGTGTLSVNLTANTGLQFDSGTTALEGTTFTTSAIGMVPNPGTASGNFLKDDGTWATPAGGFANWVVTSDDTNTTTVNTGDTIDWAGGTGISTTLSGGTLTITNDAPDQTVSLTGAGTTSISGTYPSFTITSNDQYDGTVTSVGLSMPAEFSVASSPVTTAGTIAVTKATQVANTIYAGPATAPDAAPTFRTLGDADIPATIMRSWDLGGDSGADLTVNDGERIEVSGGSGITTTMTVNGVSIANNAQFTGFDIDADSGTAETIVNGDTITFTGGTGVSTAVSATDTITFTNSLPFNDLTISGDSGTATLVDGDTLNFTGSGTGMTFTAATGTPDTVTLAGTLDVDNGGTGQTSYTNGQLLIGNTTGNTLTKATLTQGTGITITNGTGSIEVANSLPFNTLTLAGDGGSSQTIVDGDTITVSGGTTGLTFNGVATDTVELTGTLDVDNGGTGLSTTPTAGQLLIGNGTNSDYDLATLTQGTGISITNADGSIEVANSLAFNDLTITGDTGTATLVDGDTLDFTGSTSGLTFTVGTGTPDTVTLGGTLDPANGGTGQSTYTNGQLLIGNSTGNTLSKSTLTQGTGITITNGTGTIEVANSLAFNDLTISGDTAATATLVDGDTLQITGGSTGLTFTVASGTPDTTTLGGTLDVGYGGTGATTLTQGGILLGQATAAVVATGQPTDGQLLIGSTGIDPVLNTLTAGSGIGISNGAGTISISNNRQFNSLTLAGDSGPSQTITDGNTITIAGGTALSSVASATDTVTINLDNTAVTAASYGSATQVGTFTVDAQGRLTAAANATIQAFTLDADSGTPETVLSTDTVMIAGGTNISTTVSATDTVTIDMDTGGIGAGTYGSTADDTKIDQITVDAYGRITGITTGDTGIIHQITNNSNNRVLTANGTSNPTTINAEALMTFDGSTLTVGNATTQTVANAAIKRSTGVFFGNPLAIPQQDHFGTVMNTEASNAEVNFVAYIGAFAPGATQNIFSILIDDGAPFVPKLSEVYQSWTLDLQYIDASTGQFAALSHKAIYDGASGSLSQELNRLGQTAGNGITFNVKAGQTLGALANPNVLYLEIEHAGVTPYVDLYVSFSGHCLSGPITSL